MEKDELLNPDDFDENSELEDDGKSDDKEKSQKEDSKKENI